MQGLAIRELQDANGSVASPPVLQVSVQGFIPSGEGIRLYFDVQGDALGPKI